MTLAAVTERAGAAAMRAGRRPDEVRLIAVTKERSVTEIRAVYETGHRDFGENRAQELAGKIPQLPADIRWHFIGPLQRNKVRLVRPAVVLLHSLDRVELAGAWMKGPGRPPPALLQVNIGREPQKHGVPPEEAVRVAEEVLEMGVPLAGVMAIPPVVERAEMARPYFVELRAIRDRIAVFAPQAAELSMGMTDDFEVAIEEGATMIRVGRAIFQG